MKTYLICFFVCFLSFTFNINTFGQGCVVIRSMSSCSASGTNAGGVIQQTHSRWQLNTNYRYFQSFRHFRGDVEEHERIENGTQVINTVNALDLGVSYQVNNRTYVAASIPIIHNDRSSLYEHYGNSLATNPDQVRFHTKSAGFGDLRLSAGRWLIDPEKQGKFNTAVGIGIKLPTGNYAVTDAFHKLSKEGTETILNLPVDQSIQLGDGGVGYTVDLQGYLQLFGQSSLYFNGFYMLNPQNTNGIIRRPDLSDVNPTIESFSIPDQFAARLGFNQMLNHALSVSLGGRVEGVPAHDLLGKSEGYRRPGYIVSLEPAISYMTPKFALLASVPYSLYRNRTKSVYDLQDPTGLRHGDAAFADYLINISFNYFLGKTKAEKPLLSN